MSTQAEMEEAKSKVLSFIGGSYAQRTRHQPPHTSKPPAGPAVEGIRGAKQSASDLRGQVGPRDHPVDRNAQPSPLPPHPRLQRGGAEALPPSPAAPSPARARRRAGSVARHARQAARPDPRQKQGLDQPPAVEGIGEAKNWQALLRSDYECDPRVSSWVTPHSSQPAAVEGIGGAKQGASRAESVARPNDFAKPGPPHKKGRSQPPAVEGIRGATQSASDLRGQVGPRDYSVDRNAQLSLLPPHPRLRRGGAEALPTARPPSPPAPSPAGVCRRAGSVARQARPTDFARPDPPQKQGRGQPPAVEGIGEAKNWQAAMYKLRSDYECDEWKPRLTPHTSQPPAVEGIGGAQQGASRAESVARPNDFARPGPPHTQGRSQPLAVEGIGEAKNWQAAMDELRGDY